MNKSMKQIADELGVDKQQVYRFINKNHIIETFQKGNVKLYDEMAQSTILSYFAKNSPDKGNVSIPLGNISKNDSGNVSNCTKRNDSKTHEKTFHETIQRGETHKNWELNMKQNSENGNDFLKEKNVSKAHNSELIASLQNQIEVLKDEIKALKKDKEWLLGQCDAKDKQINIWTQVAAEFNKKSEPKLIEDKIEERPKKGFWSRLFRRD